MIFIDNLKSTCCYCFQKPFVNRYQQQNTFITMMDARHLPYLVRDKAGKTVPPQAWAPFWPLGPRSVRERN